jgi:hypothetical protein
VWPTILAVMDWLGTSIHRTVVSSDPVMTCVNDVKRVKCTGRRWSLYVRNISRLLRLKICKRFNPLKRSDAGIKLEWKRHCNVSRSLTHDTLSMHAMSDLRATNLPSLVTGRRNGNPSHRTKRKARRATVRIRKLEMKAEFSFESIPVRGRTRHQPQEVGHLPEHVHYIRHP